MQLVRRVDRIFLCRPACRHLARVCPPLAAGQARARARRLHHTHRAHAAWQPCEEVGCSESSVHPFNHRTRPPCARQDFVHRPGLANVALPSQHID